MTVYTHRFICLERLPQTNSPPGSAQSHRPPSESSSFNRDAWKVVRKRVIYAHSDILKRRCDYFNTMLSSSFAESTHSNLPLGERRMFDVVVEEADFVTVYWLLKWVYGNWLLFKEEDDPRDAVTSMGGGWSAKWLAHDGRNEWEPRSLVPSTSTSDTGSVTSLDSSPTSPPGRDNGKGKSRNPHLTLLFTLLNYDTILLFRSSQVTSSWRSCADSSPSYFTLHFLPLIIRHTTRIKYRIPQSGR